MASICNVTNAKLVVVGFPSSLTCFATRSSTMWDVPQDNALSVRNSSSTRMKMLNKPVRRLPMENVANMNWGSICSKGHCWNISLSEPVKRINPTAGVINSTSDCLAIANICLLSKYLLSVGYISLHHVTYHSDDDDVMIWMDTITIIVIVDKYIKKFWNGKL